jgi:DNA-binding NtrC family response regulator
LRYRSRPTKSDMQPETALHVLVVDGDLEMAAMIADELLDHGYQALAVQSGREAFAHLKRERWDAFVAASRLADADGMDLVRASLALDPSRPIIVMTAPGGIGSIVEEASQGTCQYLAKPFSLARLVEMLDAALHARRRAEH